MNENEHSSPRKGDPIKTIAIILFIILIVYITILSYFPTIMQAPKNGFLGLFGKNEPKIEDHSWSSEPIIKILVICSEASYEEVTIKLTFYDEYNMVLKEELLTGHDYTQNKKYLLRYYITDEKLLLADHYSFELHEYK